MSTTQKVLMPAGDSTTFGETDLPGQSHKGMILMARPDFITCGNVHNLTPGPFGTTKPSLFGGDNRSYHQGTNGITIGGLTAIIVARMNSAVPTLTHMLFRAGINDINAGTPAATMLTDLGTFLDTMHAAPYAAVKVLVGQIPNEIFGGAPMEAIRVAYNAGIAGVVSSRSSYATAGGAVPTLSAEHFGDLQGIHWNARGARLVATRDIADMNAAGW